MKNKIVSAGLLKEAVNEYLNEIKSCEKFSSEEYLDNSLAK